MIGFSALHDEADARRPRLPVAAAGGDDPSVLEALRTARDRGWVEPIVCGDPGAIRRVADEAGIDLDGFAIVAAGAGESAPPAGGQGPTGRAPLPLEGRRPPPHPMHP